MPENERSQQIRNAAFQHVRQLACRQRGHITGEQIKAGFTFEGKRVHLRNPQQGIFKPAVMEFLLSIVTSIQPRGGRIWYADQRHDHQEIFDDNGLIPYDYMRGGPQKIPNQQLRKACEQGIPIIYFRGIKPQLYMPLLAYIDSCDDVAQKAYVACKGLLADGLPDQISGIPSELTQEPARQYIRRNVEQRLHQSQFREAVIAAYDERCAISGLPMPKLLDAAHIIPDGDPDLGQPIVRNGLALSKLHHAAFDANFIGITPDYRLELSENLLDTRDGPMLETLKQINGTQLRLPNRKEDHPDPERLEKRYAEFREAA